MNQLFFAFIYARMTKNICSLLVNSKLLGVQYNIMLFRGARELFLERPRNLLVLKSNC